MKDKRDKKDKKRKAKEAADGKRAEKKIKILSQVVDQIKAVNEKAADKPKAEQLPPARKFGRVACDFNGMCTTLFQQAIPAVEEVQFDPSLLGGVATFKDKASRAKCTAAGTFKLRWKGAKGTFLGDEDAGEAPSIEATQAWFQMNGKQLLISLLRSCMDGVRNIQKTTQSLDAFHIGFGSPQYLKKATKRGTFKVKVCNAEALVEEWGPDCKREGEEWGGRSRGGKPRPPKEQADVTGLDDA